MIHKKAIEVDKLFVRPTYSLGFEVKGGTLIFISGRLALDSKGNLVGKGDIEAQTRHIYESLKVVMEACGGTIDDIFKVTSYFTNADDILRSAKVRSAYLKKPYPASTSVVVKRLIHEEALLEVEAVALIDK